ncbi:MAG: formate dehydrogenase accessory sulfurtransferase FdhD [Chloroflexi bacterium]|nr:formate dehydrogenase accessory sulfurtransferase FdhD [Chloroflexota bacterium]
MHYHVDFAEDRPVVQESAWALIVNGRACATFLCTPEKLGYLALGFLANEGLIAGSDDLASLEIDSGNNTIRTQLTCERRLIRNPQSANCNSFDDLAGDFTPLNSHQFVTPPQVIGLMEGRHNTLDKIRGECLTRGISTKNRILLTTARLSSEMLGKAVRMGTPIVISRSSPTDLSVRLARRWGMTIIGYVSGQQMSVYSGRERVETFRRNVPTNTEALISCAT